MDQIKQDDTIKVDLEKGSSKDFEIHTMADDLSKVSSAKPSPTPAPTPIATPAATPVVPMDVPLQTSPPPSPLQAPAPSPEGLSQPPEFLFEEESRTSWMKSFLIGFILVLLVGAIGAGGWWWYNKGAVSDGGNVTTTPIDDGEENEDVTPQPSTSSLVPVDRSSTLTVKEGDTRATFLSSLASLLSSSKEDLPVNNVVEVIVMKGEKRLTLKEFSAMVDVDFSQYVDDGPFSLVFLTTPGDPVFGFVVRVTDVPGMKGFMATREAGVPALADELYAAYTQSSLPQAGSQVFLDNLYQGVNIRYLNFDSPSRAVDYAFYEDLLLLGGSRDMIFSLIERAKLRDILGTDSVEEESTDTEDTMDQETSE